MKATRVMIVCFLILSGLPVFAASGLADDGLTMMMVLAGIFLFIAALLKGVDLIRKNRHRIQVFVISAWKRFLLFLHQHGRKHEFSHPGIL